jgi:hypothetical protein
VASQHPRKFEKRYWGEHFFHELPDTGLARLSTEMCITACDTLHAAYKLGASEVWLYGCDFAISGKVQDDTTNDGAVFLLEKYYHDVSAQEGMAIREGMFPVKPPVVGINGRIVFVTWELMCYAAYLAVMAHMIENYGGVRVTNHTPCGIMRETWHTQSEVTHVNDVSDSVQVCTAPPG